MKLSKITFNSFIFPATVFFSIFVFVLAAPIQGVKTTKEPKSQYNCDPKTGEVDGKIEIGEFEDLQKPGSPPQKMACPKGTCDEAKPKQLTTQLGAFKKEKTSFSKRVKKVGGKMVCDKPQVAQEKGDKPMDFKDPKQEPGPLDELKCPECEEENKKALEERAKRTRGDYKKERNWSTQSELCKMLWPYGACV